MAMTGNDFYTYTISKCIREQFENEYQLWSLDSIGVQVNDDGSLYPMYKLERYQLTTA